MKKSILFFGIIGLLLLGGLGAQEKSLLPSLKAVEELNLEFMNQLSQGNVPQAFELVKPYTPVTPQALDQLRDLTQRQYEMLDRAFGKSAGFKLVEKKAVGDCLVRYTYLELREKYPIRWLLVYYRPQLVWLPVSLKWDIQINSLF